MTFIKPFALFCFVAFSLIDLCAQAPEGLEINSCPSSAGGINMTIYHGVSEIEVPDADEESLGAVTVANKNDTDEDGWIDNQDDFTFNFNPVPKGPDVDLMKLVLDQPVNYIPNQKIKISVISGANRVKMYRSNVKDGPLDKIPVEFTWNELPLNLYVEVTEKSETLARDIEIKMEYNGESDIVKATAVWLEESRVWVIRDTSCAGTGCPENPIAGGGRLEAVLNSGLPTIINNLRISQDGSRYGHGYNTKIGSIDNGYGGRILHEFLFYPLNTDPELLKVTFDCTRQRKTRVMMTPHGQVPGSDDINERVDFNINSELPNDDPSQSDEDNIADYTPNYDGKPAGYRIHVWDRPGIQGLSTIAQSYAFWATKNSFKEFVRVQIAGATPVNGNEYWGSRASEKYDWSCVYYTRSGLDNSIMIPDSDAVSCSFPQKVGIGNGVCNVILLPNAVNAGYYIVYSASQDKWALKSGNTVLDTSMISSGSPGPRTWILNYLNILSLTISEKPSPLVQFVSGSKFNFSIFRTSGSKVNSTSRNPILITNNSF